MFMAIVRISIKAIKFEDITVTFQPINPNKPIIIITEVAHPNKGMTTHLIFLKMNQRVKTIKIKTPIPNLKKTRFKNENTERTSEILSGKFGFLIIGYSG